MWLMWERNQDCAGIAIFFKNAKREPEIVQESRFSFKNAKREPEIVQESRFSVKNARRELEIVQES